MISESNWLIEMSNDENYWEKNSDVLIKLPNVIYLGYMDLYDMACKGNVYGCMLKIKDIYEMLIKIPIIMAIAIIDDAGKLDSVDDSNDLLELMLKEPLVMGSYHTLAKHLISTCDCRVTQKTIVKLPDNLLRILYKTCGLFESRIADKTDIVNWRNETIAHGSIKIENSIDYQAEFDDLLINLKSYFGNEGITFDDPLLSESVLHKKEKYYRKRAHFGIKGLYDNIAIYINNERLSGMKYISCPNGVFSLACENNRYPIKNMIIDNDDGNYYFNDYMSKKHRTKHSDLYSGKTIVRRDKYFDNLYNMLLLNKASNIKATDGIVTQKEDSILNDLKRETDYIKPDYIIEEIGRIVRNSDSGLISLQMERGTGKTALTHYANELNSKKRIFDTEDMHYITRSYFVSDMKINGRGDFKSAIDRLFSINGHNESFRIIDEELLQKRELVEPSVWVSKTLELYLKLYKRNGEYADGIILFIDGIDEIDASVNILDYIPDAKSLPEGCFIIVTSRVHDENNIGERGRQAIETIERRSGVSNNENPIITVRRNTDKMKSLLFNYLKHKNSVINDDKIDKLLEFSDYRFLYLKAILVIFDNLGEKLPDPKAVISNYLSNMEQAYGRSGFNRIKQILSIISLLGKAEYQLITDLLGISAENRYMLLGMIHDLQPLLSVIRESDTDCIEFANVEYEIYFYQTYKEEIQSIFSVITEYFFSEDNVSCYIDELFSDYDYSLQMVTSIMNNLMRYDMYHLIANSKEFVHMLLLLMYRYEYRRMIRDGRGVRAEAFHETLVRLITKFALNPELFNDNNLFPVFNYLQYEDREYIINNGIIPSIKKGKKIHPGWMSYLNFIPLRNAVPCLMMEAVMLGYRCVSVKMNALKHGKIDDECIIKIIEQIERNDIEDEFVNWLMECLDCFFSVQHDNNAFHFSGINCSFYKIEGSFYLNVIDYHTIMSILNVLMLRSKHHKSGFDNVIDKIKKISDSSRITDDDTKEKKQCWIIGQTGRMYPEHNYFKRIVKDMEKLRTIMGTDQNKYFGDFDLKNLYNKLSLIHKFGNSQGKKMVDQMLYSIGRGIVNNEVDISNTVIDDEIMKLSLLHYYKDGRKVLNLYIDLLMNGVMKCNDSILGELLKNRNLIEKKKYDDCIYKISEAYIDDFIENIKDTIIINDENGNGDSINWGTCFEYQLKIETLFEELISDGVCISELLDRNIEKCLTFERIELQLIALSELIGFLEINNIIIPKTEMAKTTVINYREEMVKRMNKMLLMNELLIDSLQINRIIKCIITSFISTHEIDKGYDSIPAIADEIHRFGKVFPKTGNTLSVMSWIILCHMIYYDYLKEGRIKNKEDYNSLQFYYEPDDYLIPGEELFRSDIEKGELPQNKDYFQEYCNSVRENILEGINLGSYELDGNEDTIEWDVERYLK